MSTTWRLIDHESENPYLNMAIEESIPSIISGGTAPDTIRFWRNVNTVVVGRFQNPMLEVNFEACSKHRTDIVRRFTGGGAVYHDLGNLNYAVSLRKNNPLLREDLLGNFRIVTQGVILGLRNLGLRCEYGPGNLIHVNGRKLSGIAGSLSGNTFFEHGTLLVNTDLQILSEVLASPSTHDAETRGVRSIKSPVTSLVNELRRDISLSQTKRVIVEGFEEAFSIRLIPSNLTSTEKRLAQELYEKKYSKHSWNHECI